MGLQVIGVEQEEKSSDLLEGEGLRTNTSANRSPGKAQLSLDISVEGVEGTELWAEKVIRQSQKTPALAVWEECVQEVCQKLQFL